MTDDREVSEGADDVVAESTRVAARWAGRVGFDVGELLAYGGAGDGDTEFDGSADGIGDKVCILVHGPCGGRGRRREPSSSQHRTLLHLVPHLSIRGPNLCTLRTEEPRKVIRTLAAQGIEIEAPPELWVL